MHNNLAEGKLSRIMATLQLKTLASDADAIKLIADCGAINIAIWNSVLETLNLNRFQLLIDANNLNGIKFPDFSMCKRTNLTHENFTSSPMHILNLVMLFRYYFIDKFNNHMRAFQEFSSRYFKLHLLF